MSSSPDRPIDREQIARLLTRHKDRMKLYLSHCMRCTLCAESCFLYMSRGKDPRYMPSYKVINSVGVLYRKSARLEREDLERMKGIVWRDCALCTRCYCPVGVDVPGMIAFARGVLRSQGIHPGFDEDGAMESWL